jgi:hypothetical protein
MSKPSQYACLNVIDGRQYELPDDEEFSIRYAAPYSRIDGVITGEAFLTPPENIFGPEPEHTWCYYYQKAMVARQIGDWAEIARLGDEARQKGFEPANQVEWRPFLEGYIQSGQSDDAAAIAVEIKKIAAPHVGYASSWRRALPCRKARPRAAKRFAMRFLKTRPAAIVPGFSRPCQPPLEFL